MPDRKPLATTGELAALLSAELLGPADIGVHGVAALDDAAQGDLTFVRSDRYAARWAKSRASAAIVSRGVAVEAGEGRAVLLVEDADRAMVALLEVAADRMPKPERAPGVHPSAVVDPGASVDPSVSVGAGAVIGAGVRIGPGSVVGPNCVIEAGVRIGAETLLHPHVVLRSGAVIGNGCELHAGVVIGTDGFGYLPSAQGPIKVPHLGGVAIGDGVEIGANSCVDRGKFSDTTIGDATKIDNLVQIGHNCRVGRGVVICGCAALGGSVRVGDGAVIGGAVSVRDNVSITAGAQIGGSSIVDGDVDSAEPWFGHPARPGSAATRVFASLQKLPKLREDVLSLKSAIKEFERRLGERDG
jgi:UDP-3-O-[3-hydroxymyristoyl] glucosamine N-acyltransferase